MAGSGDGDSRVPGLEINENGEVVKFDFSARVHAVLRTLKPFLRQVTVAGTGG